MTANGPGPYSPGWNVQAQAPSPYAQPSVGGVPSVFTGNGSPGAPGPVPGNVTSILANPGYADVNPAYLAPGVPIPASAVPVPASGTPFTNPASLAASVVITGGTLTSVKTAAYGGSLAQVGTGDGTYTVPPAGQVQLTYTSAPAWTWTTSATAGAA